MRSQNVRLRVSRREQISRKATVHHQYVDRTTRRRDPQLEKYPRFVDAWSAEMEAAKIFEHGGSQAVRLPKDFRFDTTEVRIRRHGASVILEPVPQDWAWLTPLIGPVDADFEEAATTEPAAHECSGPDVFE